MPYRLEVGSPGVIGDEVPDGLPAFSGELAQVLPGDGDEAVAIYRVSGDEIPVVTDACPMEICAPRIDCSARPEDVQAVHALYAAAKAAMPLAPEAATRWLRAALRLLPLGEPMAAARLVLLWELALAFGAAGRLREGRDTLHELVLLLPPEPSGRRTRAVTYCAMLERQLGRHAEARGLLLRELARVPSGDAAEVAGLKLELAACSFMHGDIDAGRSWASQALEGARKHGDQPVEVGAVSFLATWSSGPPDTVRAAGQLDEAASLIDGMLDGELAQHVNVVLWLGIAELSLERHHTAIRHLERGLAITRVTGHTTMTVMLLMGLSGAFQRVGRLREATELSSEAVETALLPGSAELRAMALVTQSWIAAWTGDAPRALHATSAHPATLACSLDGWFGVLASVTHSCARALADDPVGCAELIVNRSGGPELPCIYPQQRVYWFEILVRAELAQGNAEMAAEWAARAEASASGVGLAGQAGMAMLARAQVLASQDPATAAEHALAAASALSSAGCVLDAGRAHLLAGQTLSDPGQARYELKRAKVIFTECAAEGLNKSVLREQRRQAARVPRSRDGARGAGLGALTPRELETAQLVGEGLSNQMIARRLSVTIKTVEKHLSSVFAKVGVSSRAALAGMVARFDPESEAEAG